MELVMRAGPVVAIGECMLELARADGEWRLAAGGDTYNCAVYMARLGADVGYLTALGLDPFSADLRERWAAEGIDTGLVLAHPSRAPGLYAVTLDEHGERSFVYWRDRSAARALFECEGVDEALERAGRAALLYLSGITLSLFDRAGLERLRGVMEKVRGRGGAVAFDPNYRLRLWPGVETARAAVELIAPFVSIALPTQEDERALWGDADPAATARRWRELGCAESAVKLGPAGALAGDRLVAPSAPVRAVDTTGAGDSFNAAYLCARLAGLAPAEAAAAGNRLAGEVIRHPGAVIPRAVMPDGLPRPNGLTNSDNLVSIGPS